MLLIYKVHLPVEEIEETKKRDGVRYRGLLRAKLTKLLPPRIGVCSKEESEWWNSTFQALCTIMITPAWSSVYLMVERPNWGEAKSAWRISTLEK